MAQSLFRIRLALAVFVAGLLLSGLTAFPLEAEVDWLHARAGASTEVGRRFPDLGAWVDRVHAGVAATGREHPFLFYGTDWLAFAHLVIAVAFLGPIRDPVRNVWVLEFGMIACALVIPMALIAGQVRGIPFFWRLVDCSFGVLGFLPLACAWTWTRRLS